MKVVAVQDQATVYRLIGDVYADFFIVSRLIGDVCEYLFNDSRLAGDVYADLRIVT